MSIDTTLDDDILTENECGLLNSPSKRNEEDAICCANTNSCSICDLPQEVLIHIFSFLSTDLLLSRVALVCSKWRTLAMDPILWTSISFSKDWDEENVLIILEKCYLTKELRFEQRKINGIICKKISRLKFLTSLTLMCCSLDDEVSSSFLIDKCGKLSTINFEGSTGINVDLLRQISNLPQLISLNLFNCRDINSSCLTEIAEHCLKLKNLNIDSIQFLGDKDIDHLVECKSSTLRELCLDGELLTDASFCSLYRCENLEKLSISYGTEITDKSLRSINKMKFLTFLRIRKAAQLTRSGFENFFLSNKNMSNLVHINFNHCEQIEDSAMEAISKVCPYLKSIELQWCWEITDLGVQSLVSNCNRLEVIDLVGNFKICGLFLQDVVRYLPNVEVIDFEQCSLISDDLVQEFLKQNPFVIIYDYWGDRVNFVPK